MRRGRKGKYEKWLESDGLLLLAAWARDGLTDEQIARKMGISRSTLAEWKTKFPGISDALKGSKELADIEVENALFKSATGHYVTVRKTYKLKKRIVSTDGTIREAETVETKPEEIYIPPNVAAQIFWTKNRKPAEWRDKPDYTDEAIMSKLDAVLDKIEGNI